MQFEGKKTLNIIEIFKSIQGETTFAGLPTTFIRLASCNLRCSWCDTTYSFGRGKPHTLDDIISLVESNRCSHVCITGGEPLLQANIHPLMKALCSMKYTLSIETGGSLPIDKIDPRVVAILDIKCPGSGMSRKNYWPNLELLREKDEIKFVILDETDYSFAIEICQKYALFERKNLVLFSPVFDKLDPQLMVQWILRDNIPVRLNLQIHKFIWTPGTKGV